MLELQKLKQIGAELLDLVKRLRTNPVTNGFSFFARLVQRVEIPQGFLDKFALRNSGESSDFPEGPSPEGQSDDPREVP